jgi:D-threo-aldose 1-dehydrogenase
VQTLDSHNLDGTGVEVTRLGFGSAAIGNVFDAVSRDDAIEAVGTALDTGIRFFDTAPYYGYGLSEHRLGAALAGVERSRFTISTKIGRILGEGLPQDGDALFSVPPDIGYRYDYSAAGVRRSLADSMARLKLDRIDVALIHDVCPTVHTDTGAFEGFFAQAVECAWPVLAGLRADGVLGAIGFGINDWRTAERLAALTDPDVILLAGRYTLLEQEAAQSFLPMCLRRGISVVIGGPFNSGILAAGPEGNAMYDYLPAGPAILDRVRRIDAVCRRHGVPLAAAALQFPFGHAAVAAVIPGMRSPDEVRTNTILMEHLIPDLMWQDLWAVGLLADDAATPRGLTD